MKVLRVTQKAKNGKLVIRLPEEYGKHDLMDIIIFPHSERPSSKSKIDVKKLKGSVNLNMTVEQIEEECRKMRSEWDRGF